MDEKELMKRLYLGCGESLKFRTVNPGKQALSVRKNQAAKLPVKKFNNC